MIKSVIKNQENAVTNVAHFENIEQVNTWETNNLVHFPENYSRVDTDYTEIPENEWPEDVTIAKRRIEVEGL